MRGVLFDWDGTLVHEDGLSLQGPCDAVAVFVREALGLPVEAEALEAAFEAALPPYTPGESLGVPHIDDVLAAAFDQLDVRPDRTAVRECSRLFFEAGARRLRLYDDARALLASLRMRGYVVGVVTNTIFPGHFLRANLGNLGIAGYVDSLVTSLDAGFGKPHPAPYQRALADLALQPDQAIFVGDRLETDIAGARAAGIHAVLLDRTGRRNSDGVPVVERLSALNEILGESAIG